MPAENTPLASSVTAQDALKAAKGTKDFAKSKLKEMRQMARDGAFSIRFFALLGGVGMVVVSGFGFFSLFLGFHLVRCVVEMYAFLMGLVIILLETGRQVPGLKKLLHTLHTYALFTTYLWGRGMLYFLAGSLEWTQVSLWILVHR